METVELSAIDIRFAHTRRRDAVAERRLLSSIMERDILDPLGVVVCQEGAVYVLIDGFKRYRCAKKLKMGIVPIECIGTNVVEGMLSFLRRGIAGGLSDIEEAALIDELNKGQSLSIYDIALRLERSPSWVSMRLGMISEMSGLVRRKILSGEFPARAYMYGIKGFTRVNKIPQKRVDQFVNAVSGKHLSTRELFILTRAYFTSGPAIEKLVLEGDVHKALRILTADQESQLNHLEEPERLFIKDLKAISMIMNRIMENAPAIRSSVAEVNHHINLWTHTILDRAHNFWTVLRDLHDRSKPPGSSAHALPAGSGPQNDCPAITD